MASTYSSLLRLELMADGEKAGLWGGITNVNLGTILEKAIAGTATIVQGDVANYTLTELNGVDDEARCAVINVTGALSLARNVVCPTGSKLYLVRNNTTGGLAITFKTTAGTGIAVQNGESALLYCDGTNVINAVSQVGSSIFPNTGLRVYDTNTTHALTIAPGSNLTAARTFTLTTGDAARTLDISAASVTVSAFGATLVDDVDAATARTTLGIVVGTLASQDANNVSITGGTITGITDLAVADGGTGASNAASARTNLGLGTISTQSASAIAITGGTITGITDLTVADGGTGVSTLTGIAKGNGAAAFSAAIAGTDYYAPGGTDIPVTDGGTGSSTAAGARSNLGVLEAATNGEVQTGTSTTTVVTPAGLTAKEASIAEWRAKTADRILTTDVAWDAMAFVTLTDAATIALNASTFINGAVTLAGNRTLGDFTSPKVGQAGIIRATASGATRTLQKGTNMRSASDITWPISIASGETAYVSYYIEGSANTLITGVLNNPT